MKILAVDDDRIILGLLLELLQGAEYGEVLTASSAEDALGLIRDAETPFDCFLLDIEMPGMDGIELCAEIRKIPRHRRTPILMLTAMSEKSFIDRAFAAGASDYITKPLDPTEIIVRLGLAEQLMQERKSLQESAGVVDSLIEVLDRSTQHDVEEAIDLGKMDRLLRYPAFENYVYQSGRGVLFLSTMFAAKLRNVTDLHRNLPPLEFKNVLRNAAAALIARLGENEVFITYRGEGEFVGVVPRKGQQALKALGRTLSIDIRESEGKYAAKLPETATLVLGDPVPVRLPTRGELAKAIQTAVEKVRFRTDPRVQQEIKSRAKLKNPYPFARLFWETRKAEDNLRAEFMEMLRDQLNTEVGEHRKAKTPGSKGRATAFQKRDAATRKTGMKSSTKQFPKVPAHANKTPGTGQIAKPVAERPDGAKVLPIQRDGSGTLRVSNA